MSSIKFSELLFDKGKGTVPINCINGNVRYGDIAVQGMGFSPARTTTNASAKAKINNVISVLEEDNYYVGLFTDGIYLETDSTAATLTYDRTNQVWTFKYLNNKAPYGKNAISLGATMLFKYGLSHNLPKFTHSNDSYINCLFSIAAKGGKITPEEAYTLCDSFYYEVLNSGSVTSSTEFNVDELTITEISTLNRNASITYINGGLKSKFITNTSKSKTPSSTPASSSNVNITKKLFEEAKAGEFLLPIEWKDEQWDKIPPLTFLDEYVPCEEFFVVLRLVRSRMVNIIEGIKKGEKPLRLLTANLSNFIFCGKAGSGKSTAAKALAAALGLPLYVVPIQKNSEEDEFEGKTRAVKGSFNFVETDFLSGYENGGLIILEEINLANAGVTMGGLGQAIVPPFVLKKNGYEETHRNPYCVICGTMNVGTQGSVELNEGLKSRFPLVMEMNEPTNEEIIDILSSKGYIKENCKKVLKAYTSVVTYLQSQDMQDLAMSVTLRHAIECLALLENGANFNMACKYTLCGVIALSDGEIAQNVFESCIEPLK